MELNITREYIDAVLQLRNTAQLQVMVEHLTEHRNLLLTQAMTAPDEQVHRLRHRAAAYTEILNSITQIEQIRQEYEDAYAEAG